MSEAYRRYEELQRQRFLLPEHLRYSTYSGERNIWLRVNRVDQFSQEDLAMLASRDFFLDINPEDQPIFDLSHFAGALTLFRGIRLQADADAYRGLSAISDLDHLTTLRATFSIDSGIDVSGLTSLTDLSCGRDVLLTAVRLPNLQNLAVEWTRELPAGVRMAAPIRTLYVRATTLNGLDFLANVESLAFLDVEAPRFQFDWLDPFTALRSLRLSDVGEVEVGRSSAVLNLSIDIEFDNVSAVSGARNLALLPGDAYVGVKENHAFPRELQTQLGRPDWSYETYSARNGGDARRPAPDSAEADLADADGVTFYPFILFEEDDSIVLQFDNWGLLGGAQENVSDTVNAVMFEVAKAEGVPVVDDSEADVVRMLFDDRVGAEKVGTVLRDRWVDGRGLN